jgi:hypothetical protein
MKRNKGVIMSVSLWARRVIVTDNNLCPSKLFISNNFAFMSKVTVHPSNKN